MRTKSLRYFTWYLPQSTEVEAGSGIRECRQRVARPAPRELPERPGCSASALHSLFLHSLEELQDESEPSVSVGHDFAPSGFWNANR